jgi:FMN hydrolase / 5-amino-6-(5-phospho-D-ribitylamino)uracil phosphatase
MDRLEAGGGRREAEEGRQPSANVVPSPGLVLFDLDDTLCDYAGARTGRLRIAFANALAHLPDGGGGVDLERLIAESVAIHPHGSDHFGDLLGRYGVTDPAVAEATRAWYQANRFLGLELFDDAAETLRFVRAALPGRRIGVVTNGPTEVQRDKIALLALAPALDFALISGEFGVAKPDPAIFWEALRRGGAAADDAVFVGDSPDFDVAGARAAGIRAIWVNRTGRPWSHEAPPPDHEVRTLAEVGVLLGNG